MRSNIRIVILLAIFPLLLMNSCGKIANQLVQAISWQGIDVTFTVPPVPDTAYHSSIGAGSFTFDLDSFIKSQTGNLLGMKNVDTFRFTSCVLTITNPSTANNFANFESAQAFFSTTTNPNIVNLGQITNNPNVYSATMTLPVNNTTNLRTYLPTSGPVVINYSCGGNMRTVTTTSLNVTAHVEYYIHVTQ